MEESIVKEKEEKRRMCIMVTVPENCMACKYNGEVVAAHTSQTHACKVIYALSGEVVPMWKGYYSDNVHPQCPLKKIADIE